MLYSVEYREEVVEYSVEYMERRTEDAGVEFFEGGPRPLR